MSAVSTRRKAVGRKSGGSNRGYYFRKGRGWTVTGTATVLRDSDGKRLSGRHTPETTLRRAYIDYRTAIAVEVASRPQENVNLIPVAEICSVFLTACKEENAWATYDLRARNLFDFVCGLPGGYYTKSEEELIALEKVGKIRRIHNGLGAKLLCDLTKYDVEQWLRAHPEWNKGGGRKGAIQSIKRAINWAVEMGYKSVKSNPIKGFSAGQSNARITYFTPEVEKELIDNSKKDFALALRILIATGARYNCEFAKLTAAHVENLEDGSGRQKWVWPNGSKVRGKRRVIFVKLPWLVELVNELCKKHPTGPLFRTLIGKPWTRDAMKKRFERLRNFLKTKGIKFDKDDCLYTCRHTYAKRELARGLTIEKLAARMGNTRQICWEHYGQWCEKNEADAWND